MAQLSTYMWDNSTSAKSLVITSVTTSRHSWDTSSTLALSTEQSFPDRLEATSPATRAMRSISCSMYIMLLYPTLSPVMVGLLVNVYNL